MADIGGFVTEVLGVGVVVSALLGIAAFLGRSQIAHWLNKDIERIKSQYQAELESQKASHMQALEAYKVSLIAEAERAKAAQAVKTAVAVKFAEHQFTAVSQLMQAVVGLANSALDVYQHSLFIEEEGDPAMWGQVDQRLKEVNAQYERYRLAIYSSELYFDQVDIDALQKYSLFISAIVSAVGDVHLRVLRLPPNELDIQGADELLACSTIHERIKLVWNNERQVVMVLKKYTARYLSV